MNVEASLKSQIGIFEVTCSLNMFEKPFVCICLYLESIYISSLYLGFCCWWWNVLIDICTLLYLHIIRFCFLCCNSRLSLVKFRIIDSVIWRMRQEKNGHYRLSMCILRMYVYINSCRCLTYRVSQLQSLLLSANTLRDLESISSANFRLFI